MARASSSERRETQGNIPRFPDFKRWKMVKVHENPTSWVTQVIYLQQTECKQLYYTDYTVESLGLTNFDLVMKKDDFGQSPGPEMTQFLMVKSHSSTKFTNTWYGLIWCELCPDPVEEHDPKFLPSENLT